MVGDVVMEKQKYICPICGFQGLDEAPYDEDLNASYDICPCCGVEFGYDDFKNDNVKFEIARNKWISNGAKWFNKNKKPKNWILEAQLKNTELPEIKALEKRLQDNCKK